MSINTLIKDYLSELTNIDNNILVFDKVDRKLQLISYDKAVELLSEEVNNKNPDEEWIEDLEDFKTFLIDEMFTYEYHSGFNYLPKDDENFDDKTDGDFYIGLKDFMEFLYAVCDVVPTTEDMFNSYLEDAIYNTVSGNNSTEISYHHTKSGNAKTYYFKAGFYFYDEDGNLTDKEDWETCKSVYDFTNE